MIKENETTLEYDFDFFSFRNSLTLMFHFDCMLCSGADGDDVASGDGGLSSIYRRGTCVDFFRNYVSSF